jgi:hypothetical protein
MRLVRHIAPGSSPKGLSLRTMVRSEFSKNQKEKDPTKIEALKAGAIRALSNYMLYESGTKDQKLGKAMNTFNDNTRKEIKNDKDTNSNGNNAVKS